MNALRLPPRPQLTWREDAPFAEDVGDIYFAGDGLAEGRAVFLGGCGLPEGWAGRNVFTIAELGFGSGLNLLATWDAWRKARPTPQARLTFLSFEGALMDAADAARVHSRWPELAGLSARLVDSWPARARGARSVDLGDGVRLVLNIDPVLEGLKEAVARVDAWFLDGFAPAKNPDMWTDEVFWELVRLSRPGTRLATYTVAGPVRRGLAAAGWTVEKRPGHAGKRERLEAVLPARADLRSLPAPPRKVIVIGAGVAGAFAAKAFRARGCEVEVLEAGAGPASGASGNPLALVMPRLDAADSPTARALLCAFLHSGRAFGELGGKAAQRIDVRRLPANETEANRFARLLADPPLDERMLAPLDAADHKAGLLLRECYVVDPRVAIPMLLEGCRLRTATRVESIEAGANGVRLACDNGETLEAECVAVCAGAEAILLSGVALPPIEGRLGQIEYAPWSGPGEAMADGGYVAAGLGRLVFGATFGAVPPGPLPDPTDAARADNLAVLSRLSPFFAGGIDPEALSLHSRVGVRATTPDRLPFAGAAPGPGGADPSLARLRLIGGFGARGFLWAPLLAEMVASVCFGEALPVGRSVASALDPDRFRKRAARKAGGGVLPD